LRRRPISKTLEKVPDHCKRWNVKSDFKKSSDLEKNIVGDVPSHKKEKNPYKNQRIIFRRNSGPTPVARGGSGAEIPGILWVFATLFH